MKKVKLNIQKAIINKNLIAFAYRDKSKNKSGVRIIEPYLFGVDKKGSYFISGYNSDELVPLKERHKNYLLQQMDLLSVKKLKNENPIKFIKQKKQSLYVLPIFRN